MSLNVSNINSLRLPGLNFLNQSKYDPERFVQNSYEVHGDLNHPESRTDEIGQNAYYLA